MKSAAIESEPSGAHRKAVCGGCSLCCDDITISIRETDFVTSSNICSLGRDWFGKQLRTFGSCRVQGKSVDSKTAIAAAGEMLANARNPLITGLKYLSIADQQACTRLATKFGACLDVGWGDAGAPQSTVFQEMGQVTATLGQIARQCQTIVFWNLDPRRSLPRLVELYCGRASEFWFCHAQSGGESIGNGFPGNVLELNWGSSDLDEVGFLRAVVAKLDGAAGGDATSLNGGDESGSLRDFVNAVTTSPGVAWFIRGLAQNENDQPLRLIHRIVRRLNDFTKNYLISAGKNANALGAENVLTWTFGFPNAINLNQSQPRWNRDEYSAPAMLRRNAPDCVLTVTADNCEPNADQVNQLARIPTIVLHSDSHPLVENAGVSIPVARCGWDSSGDICRLDDVVLVANKLLDTNRLDAGQVLAAIGNFNRSPS